MARRAGADPGTMGHLSGNAPAAWDGSPRVVLETHRLLEMHRLDDVRASIAGGIAYLTDAGAVGVWEGDGRGRRLVHGLRRSGAEPDRRLEELLLAQLRPTGPARSTLDHHGDPCLSARCDAYRRAGRHCQVRPLRAYGVIRGAVAFHLDEGTELGDGQIEALRRYCESAGVALANAHAREELRRLAFTDALTGLANRRAIGDVMSAVRAAGLVVGVLFVDFDGLKAVNETLGYEEGDGVIAAVGRALGEVADERHVPGRLGGDEFVVILPGAGVAGASADALRLMEALALLDVPPAARPLFRGASVGWAVAAEGEDDAALLRRAAAEMRVVKSRRTGVPERR